MERLEAASKSVSEVLQEAKGSRVEHHHAQAAKDKTWGAVEVSMHWDQKVKSLPVW